MSGRMNRIKESLASKVSELSEQIESSHKAGKIPADYSLGFTNGLIFVDHLINMREGKPKFFERTTSIGTLPKPVTLNSGNALKDEMIFQSLQDAIILAARNVIESGDTRELESAIKTMDNFVNDQLEM